MRINICCQNHFHQILATTNVIREKKFGCCGCPEQREYAKAVKPYDEAGIYEYAEKIRSIGGIEDKIAALERKKDKLYNSLPVEIRNVYDDLKKERKLNNEH